MPDRKVLLKLTGITKRFPGTLALNQVGFCWF
jgi:ABC-type sugar transport system ATPase subunit